MSPSSRLPPACATPDAVATARAHALAEYPREAVGMIGRAGVYRPLANLAPGTEDFVVAPGVAAGALALIHSHTNGRDAPSERDMRQQIAMAVPWGIVLTDGETAAEPFWWGDMLDPPPLLGRAWRSGVTDCIALVRDWHRLERGVHVPELPRGPLWARRHGAAMAAGGYAALGFRPVPQAGAGPGDVLLFRLPRTPAPHHVGVLIEGQALLHHMTGELSRREPLGRWAACIEGVFRHGA